MPVWMRCYSVKSVGFCLISCNAVARYRVNDAENAGNHESVPKADFSKPAQLQRPFNDNLICFNQTCDIGVSL